MGDLRRYWMAALSINFCNLGHTNQEGHKFSPEYNSYRIVVRNTYKQCLSLALTYTASKSINSKSNSRGTKHRMETDEHARSQSSVETNNCTAHCQGASECRLLCIYIFFSTNDCIH